MDSGTARHRNTLSHELPVRASCPGRRRSWPRWPFPISLSFFSPSAGSHLAPPVLPAVPVRARPGQVPRSAGDECQGAARNLRYFRARSAPSPVSSFVSSRFPPSSSSSCVCCSGRRPSPCVLPPQRFALVVRSGLRTYDSQWTSRTALPRQLVVAVDLQLFSSFHWNSGGVRRQRGRGAGGARSPLAPASDTS